MDERLIETIELENRLTLKLYDSSRKLAGDRWLVTLIARIDVPVDPALIEAQTLSDARENAVKKALGSHVLFEQQRDRIFIDASEKEDTLGEMIEMFKNSTLQYLSHQEFPRRFLLKKIKEEMKLPAASGGASKPNSPKR